MIVSYQPLHAWMLLQIEVETGKHPKDDNSDNAFYISSKMSTSVIKMSGRPAGQPAGQLASPPASQPASQPAVRTGSTSATALEFLHNKGNCVRFMKLLF